MGKSRKRSAPSVDPEDAENAENLGNQVKRAERKRRRTCWITDVSERDKNKAINLALGPNKYSWMSQNQDQGHNSLAASLARLGEAASGIVSGPTAQELGVGHAPQLAAPSSSNAQEGGEDTDIDPLEAALEAELEAKDTGVDQLEAALEAELEAEDTDIDPLEAALEAELEAEDTGIDPLEAALDAELEAEAEVEAEVEADGEVNDGIDVIDDAELSAQISALYEEEHEEETSQHAAETTEDVCGTNESTLEEELSALYETEPAAPSTPQQTAADDVILVSSKQLGTKNSPLEILSSRESSPCVEKPAAKATAAPKKAPRRARPQRKAQAKKPIVVEPEEEVDDGADEEELIGLLDAALEFLTN
ncbi:hypothetical protein F4820DRAFT_446330 [Hypoxylon rubiginosum]|uniref:Uncharacterized protein n=1 Tax=Hypoxylon rubiginosum TaxID=110542 RepID=A0ACB9Z6L0_9PEZI|nr:hypothetical protein F4820DRAFT_446330 [Hypoxylon rubiginosum]